MAEHALAYHEPNIVTILVLTSFLLLLNLVGYALDKVIYCGLLGQLFIGVAWGTPGGHWLSTATQEVFVQLGYLGLILLVFEGGLSTNFRALKSNLFLSVFVALTGIGAPIGLSFALMAFVDATPLQAFAAGAALCSTSLGTTFTVLKTSGLTQSRLGVVLTSAAMLDDVVGLVMVQIISNLGAAGASFDAITVVRPIGVSLAFAIVVPLFCWLTAKPLRQRFGSLSARWTSSATVKSQVAFVVHTTILISSVVASSYAGTSNLFAAYLAGASISWYDSEVDHDPRKSSTAPPLSPIEVATDVQQESAGAAEANKSKEQSAPTSADAASDKVAQADGVTTEPQMLPSPAASENGDPRDGKDEPVVPAGTIESLRVDVGEPVSATTAHKVVTDLSHEGTGSSTWENFYEIPVSTIFKPLFFASIGFSIPISQMFTGSIVWRGVVYTILMALGKLFCGLWLVRLSKNVTPAAGHGRQGDGRNLPKPKSLYPASILGCAMVARGEIGFLISAVAESRGIFSSEGADASSELFLIVTWAIMLYTIAGPIAVGLFTRRVRRLQKLERGSSEGRDDPLGIWGIT